MLKEKPKGALVFVQGIWYKLGRFNKLLKWDDTEWVLSFLPRYKFDTAMKANKIPVEKALAPRN